MAYINVFEWKSEQVTEWLKGIECMNINILKAFANNHIGGQQLLNLRPYELEELGITKVGQQELILEAVEHLKNFHFNLDKENLQYLALQVGTISTCLHKQLTYIPESVTLQCTTMNDVARIISKVKTLIGWLDRYPFQGHTQYSEIRVQLLKLALELATISQRNERFMIQNPMRQIKSLAQKLSKLANYIIQDITDPMLLQPAYLDLVTLKKKESELGFYIMPSYQFIHRVTDVKYNSPAHNSGKVEDGDEIVQINYQTVVGWQYKKVVIQLQESQTDVLLTLKKRPKHTKIYGQLGLIKLPSKKRSLPYRWDNLPSPRIEFINIPDILMPSVQNTKKIVASDTEESSGNESDILTPTEIKENDKEHRIFLPKPRATVVLQRRNTVAVCSGQALINYKNIGNLVLWHNRRANKEDLDSPSLRDKSISISFGFGLELTRPTTCLEINENAKQRLKASLPKVKEDSNEKEKDMIIEEEMLNEDEQTVKSGVSKVVRFDSGNIQELHDSQYTCNVENTIIESFMPIPYADEEFLSDGNKREENRNVTKVDVPKCPVESEISKPVVAPRTLYDSNVVEAINSVVVNRETVRRGRLDKSHSTPSYSTENETPKIIVPPRQQFRQIKPPTIPPRKQPAAASTAPLVDVEINDENRSKMANVVDLKPKRVEASLLPPSKNAISTGNEIQIMKKNSIEDTNEALELITPSKVKTLTNKKKSSLLAKRRKVTLKSLGTSSTIQGHLYRRAKDKTEVAYWAKLYFVLLDTALYGFKTKDASKADCVIFLNGFTVSVAKEVHSKEFAFKVYHPKKTFYLASESSQAMSQWIDFIKLATMRGTTNLDCEIKELYSETECSEDESEIAINKQLNTSSSPFGVSNEKPLTDQPPVSKHYHLNFGSLKKTFVRGTSGNSNFNFNDNSSPLDNKFLGFFSSSKGEKKSVDIVPTAKFKTYRKVKESNGGLQLGATSMINSNVSDMYLASGTFDSNTALQPQNNVSSSQNETVEVPQQGKPLRKAHNFLHASNPNLLDFNFHQTIDFPTAHSANFPCNWDHHSGMTLLDLMLQQRAEEMKDMYDIRVDLGFERTDEKNFAKIPEKPLALPPKPSDPLIEKIQKRSLPITPDYAQSFKIDDQAILYARSKEGQKLRDFGYELISNDDEQNSAQTEKCSITDGKMWTTKRKVAPLSGSLKKKSGFNWMISHDREEPPQGSSFLGNTGSFRKSKKPFGQVGSQDKSGGGQHKNDGAEMWGQSIKLKKSSTCNVPTSSSKILRKNSAPIPYLSKLSFSSSNTKEKKLLGSPKLHRAIFGSKTNQTPSNAAAVDQEIFTTIKFPKSGESSNMEPSQPYHTQQNYPQLQSSLPPTFQPEIYSVNMIKNMKYE